MRKFSLTEIGFDTSVETEEDLIKIAQFHCSSYDDGREKLLPINTVDKAIEYFNNYGFEVKELDNPTVEEIEQLTTQTKYVTI